MSITALDLRHRRSPIPDGLDTDEWHSVAHLRGWCHNGTMCPLCRASDTTVTLLRSQEQERYWRNRAMAAETDLTHARRDTELAEEGAGFWRARAIDAEHTLTSIIEG